MRGVRVESRKVWDMIAAMKKTLSFAGCAALALSLACMSAPSGAYAQDDADRETINQTALLQSLTLGYYDGSITVGQLKELGDTGLGTFDGVDGELVMLDGHAYQVRGDGSVSEASDDVTVPFCDVTFFDADVTCDLGAVSSLDELKEALDEQVELNGANSFYMVTVAANFKQIYVRSEYKQSKPYVPLAQVLEKDQTEYQYEDVNGTIVGLYCPSYVSSINMPGWHFHFVSADATVGGHVLDAQFDSAVAQLDVTPSIKITVPETDDFNALDLSQDQSGDIKQVEEEPQRTK